MTIRRLTCAVLCGALLSIPATALARVRVAASTTDLASIASSVGGEQVEVFAIARPGSDVHRVEVLPSYMVRVAKADLYLKVGLGLDSWADGIIDGSRNPRLVKLDCGLGIQPLERPTGKVDASLGDVHPDGNPHYWLDPRNGAIVARQVAEALARLDPAHAGLFQARAEAFAKEAGAQLTRGRQVVAALPVRTILTYHASWVYLASAFGLEIVGTVEPVPGIPPTGKHLQRILALAKERRVPFLLQEPYFSDEAGRFLARETGVRVIRMSASCDGPAAGRYLAHLDQVLTALAAPPATGAK